VARLKVGDKEYVVDALTLDEFLILKRDFGVERMDLLDPRDPEHLLGYIFIAERRRNPNITPDDALKLFGGVKEVEFHLDDDEREAAVQGRPTSPSPEASSEGSAPASSGDDSVSEAPEAPPAAPASSD
jgi:hypothetical protein